MKKSKVLFMLSQLLQPMVLLLLLMLLCAIQSCSAAENLNNDDVSKIVPAILDLDHVRTRIDRQFKDLGGDADGGGGGESSIAMSLVDALQKWADALEAQVKIFFIMTTLGGFRRLVSDISIKPMRSSKSFGFSSNFWKM